MAKQNQKVEPIFERMGKKELLRRADELDKKAESQVLSQREWDLKQSISERITQLLREEEVRWFQRAKTTKILKGDNNAKYFQMVANGERRRTRIFRLEQEEGISLLQIIIRGSLDAQSAVVCR
jgi:hypothetical protein